MSSAIKAGATYFATVFGIGFLLGAMRVGLVIPHTGAVIAVLIEVPILLTLAWTLCRRITRRFQVAATVSARLAMGVVAFALLMLAELLLAVTLVGQTPAQHWASYGAIAAQIGLAAQLVFAGFPLIQRSQPA